MILGIVLLGITGPSAADDATQDPLGLRVAEGFVVQRFADDDLAHDIYSLTFDPDGQIVVAGAGYIRRLTDQDGDSHADTTETIAEFPLSGAMGLCFSDRAIFATGDGGLWRLKDGDDDGHFESHTRLLDLGGGEHGAHAVRVGPDGWLYVTCGNGTGVAARHITTATSPVADPHAGTIVRISRDHRQVEVLADGFRNAYDFAFGRFGELLTVDSDGERVHHLPWYTPTRLFDVTTGGSHGWLYSGSSNNWSWPEYFADNVARVATFGRGSPTGVVVYRHDRFPRWYRNGLFAACWTLGRVYFVPLARDGATLAGRPEIFLESIGHNGFAPVDLAIGPEGDLWIAIGGRGTRGSVFRIKSTTVAAESLTAPTAVDRVLNAPQPLSAWSREQWVPLARQLGAGPLEAAARDTSRSTAQRVRAIEVLTSQFGGLSDAAAQGIASDSDTDADTDNAAEVVARLAWSLGRSSPSETRYNVLAALTLSPAPLVQRHAWEALASLPPVPVNLEPPPAWTTAFDSPVRRVRSAAIHVARTSGAKSFRHHLAGQSGTNGRVNISARRQLAMLRVMMLPGAERYDDALTPDRAALDAARLARTAVDAEVRLEAVRLIQWAAGDVKLDVGADGEVPGYVAARSGDLSAPTIVDVGATLAAMLPSGDERLDQELARTLAMIEIDNAGVLASIAEKWTATSPAPRDIHYLIATSRIRGERSAEVAQRVARAFVLLHGKLDAAAARPSRMWPRRVEQAFRAHIAHSPQLIAALLDQPEFGHAGHTLLVNCLGDEWRRSAARLIMARLPRPTDDDKDEPNGWTAEVVGLVSCLPDEEVLPVLRDHWDDGRLADAIVQVVARAPEAQDRRRLVESLGSMNHAAVSSAASALEVLDMGDAHDRAPASPAEIAAAIAAMRTLESAIAALESNNPQHSPPQELSVLRRLDDLLSRWTQQPHWPAEAGASALETAEDVSAVATRWKNWFAEHYPQETALVPHAPADLAEWTPRLGSIDWSAGDAAHGKVIFDQRGCHQCHRAAGRLGPELGGVTTRLQRDDLLAAIIDPSRDVAPPYHTWTIQTRSGDVLRGMLVYDSPASKLLQTGPDTVVRVTGGEIIREEPSTVSLMPTGLLDGLTDQNLADLFAYLRTIE
jgi:putative heme-binding domain-containing protein